MRYLLLLVLALGLVGCAADDYYTYHDDGFIPGPYYAAESPCSIGGFAAPVTSTPSVYTGTIQQTGEPPVR